MMITMKKTILTVAAAASRPSAGCAQNASTNLNNNEMKTLTVYFSYTADNTKGIAEKVHAAVGGDLAELQPATPYTGSYDEVVEQAQDEVRRNCRPALKPLGVRFADYDRIIIGTPTWWYTMAPAVATFLSSAALAGKEVVPFMTNAGWPGHVSSRT